MHPGEGHQLPASRRHGTYARGSSSAWPAARHFRPSIDEGLAAIKRGVRESLRSSREDSVGLTLELSDHVFKTEDCAEGIRAFFEKREPEWKGR